MTKDLADELERLAKEIEEALADHDADAADAAERGERSDDWVIEIAPASARAILSALRGEQWQGIETARDALERAEQFIVNGVDLGFIRLPDADVSDPAHDTLPAIRKALRALPQPKGTSHE